MHNASRTSREVAHLDMHVESIDNKTPAINGRSIDGA
jgi:hypothetical protein